MVTFFLVMFLGLWYKLWYVYHMYFDDVSFCNGSHTLVDGENFPSSPLYQKNCNSFSCY